MPGPDQPPLLRRLPEQYFARILAAAAAAREDDDPAHPRFIDLGRGNPDLPPPAHAIEAVRSAALETATPLVHGYAPFRGHPDLKAAIAQRYELDHGVRLDPEREVVVVPGTKTAIMLVAVAAAGRGDTILLPDPGYPDYPSGVALAGATQGVLPLDATANWQPDFDAVGDAALALLNYPSNPCAVCEHGDTFERAVAWAQERGAWLMHDLAYGFLTFDGGRARSILEVEGARDCAVELWSPSKIYGMAGWRVGFVVGCAELVERVGVLLDHTAVGVWTGLQRGLVAALHSDQSDVGERRRIYLDRRNRLVSVLREAGADIAAPEGTFYAWWKLPEGVTPERLIEEARVGIAPGEGFGERGRGWARLSLAVPGEDVDEAAQRIATLLQTG
jgi:L-glutamine---4-(methylsulfanyl)-2-oxobutanoate aminotransferase